MENETIINPVKRKSPKWIAVISGILVLSLATSVFAFKRHHGPNGFMSHISEKVLDEVDASDEQRALIKTIMDNQRQQHMSAKAKHQELRGAWLDALAAPELDAQSIEQLRLQTITEANQASIDMTQTVVQIAQVLTPEQRSEIIQHIQTKIDRHQSRHHKE